MRGDLLTLGALMTVVAASAMTPHGAQARPGRFILTLKPGTIVYHGTNANRDFEVLDGPAWVTRSPKTAAWFAREWRDGQRPRILTFRLTEPYRLEILDDLDHLEEISESLGDPVGSHELAESFCAMRGTDGWIVRHNYGPNQDDILLCDPSGLELVDVGLVPASP